MQRMFCDQLLAWKNHPARKPLILKGVRQCGKTYLLKEFGRSNYDDAAYFNFEGNEALQNVFEFDLDPERIIKELSILREKQIQPEKTLLIFDEIQFCSRALTSLKYFYENAPSYHIVCAGSLLGVALSAHGSTSFPVGKVDLMTLYPMNFYEFLLANGEKMLCDYLKNLSTKEAVSETFTEKLEIYLRNYYITGGMPEVVETWVRTKNIEAVEEIQQKILDSYKLDFAKHAPPKEFAKMSMIWDSVPVQLARENQKFVFSHVKSGQRAKDLEEAMEWLIQAGLIYRVAKITKPGIPLSAYSDLSYFKLYFADIGLLRKTAKVPAEVIIERTNKNELKDIYKEFKGVLAENYVLCELVNLKNAVPFYWRSENIAEVDFIAQFGADIVPIEVKADHNSKSKSLDVYRKQYNPRISIKATMNNVSGKEVKFVPLYLAWKLDDYIVEDKT
ncbi:hypothetical protein MsAg5_02890 [Methanosarcinaceae archaeon Ag5]|uniref:ATPase n=1 Tax=Methanolapillus africanus TaxID=3028297 RepID=A0AAE4MIF7_9EURY|nr:hypothetical protein [Methanosarcinaceae archaeon Ag5]